MWRISRGNKIVPDSLKSFKLKMDIDKWIRTVPWYRTNLSGMIQRGTLYERSIFTKTYLRHVSESMTLLAKPMKKAMTKHSSSPLKWSARNSTCPWQSCNYHCVSTGLLHNLPREVKNFNTGTGSVYSVFVLDMFRVKSEALQWHRVGIT